MVSKQNLEMAENLNLKFSASRSGNQSTNVSAFGAASSRNMFEMKLIFAVVFYPE